MKIRYLIAILCIILNIICYADRTNMGVAISAFVPQKSHQGNVLSAFFYGYICTQLIGGYFAKYWGAKIVLLIGIITWTSADLLTIPTSHSLSLLFIVRCFMGCGEGVVFPCMHQMTATWFPVQERSRIVTILTSGQDLGAMISLLISPILRKTFGWTSIFLVFGVASFIWVVFFILFASSTPETHRLILPEELKYIQNNRQMKQIKKQSTKIPWSVFFKHRAAYAIYVSHFCYNYGWYVLLGWIPQYFNDVLKINLGKNSYTAALPYLCGFISLYIYGFASDYLIHTAHWRIKRVRILMNSIGMFGPAIMLFLLSYVTSKYLAILCFAITIFTGRATSAGYWVNMIDVGPNHAGQLMSVSNTIATIPGILGNLITGYILGDTTHHHDLRSRWNHVFFIASLLFMFGGTFFTIFATDINIYTAYEKNHDLGNENEENSESDPFISSIDEKSLNENI